MRNYLVERAMRTEWPSPHDLCDYLGLTPTPLQRAVFDDYARGLTDFSNSDEVIRGLCICLLWETLSNPGRTCYVMGEERLRSWVMAFMRGVIDRQPALAEVTGMGRWELSFGSDPGWRVRALLTHPFLLEGATPGSTVVILGALDDWAVEAEEAAKAARTKVVRAF